MVVRRDHPCGPTAIIMVILRAVHMHYHPFCSYRYSLVQQLAVTDTKACMTDHAQISIRWICTPVITESQSGSEWIFPLPCKATAANSRH